MEEAVGLLEVYGLTCAFMAADACIAILALIKFFTLDAQPLCRHAVDLGSRY